MLPPRIEAPIERALPFATGLIAVALSACSTSPTASGLAGLERIDHLIVIYAENRSFDNLYGLFPGANGLANATPAQY
ncbi:MAG TPA: alkaline phosphatase family protein, partial [Sphingomicrobium sp.]